MEQSRGKSIRYPNKLNTKTVKQKVITYGLSIIFFLIVYFLFFSNYYSIKYIEIVGNDAVNTADIESLIWSHLDQSWLFFFSKNNFWLASTESMLVDISKQYAFEDITVTKKYPNTISLRLIERLGRLVVFTDDKYYVIDATGIITRQLKETHLIKKTNIPVIINLASDPVEIGATILNKDLIETIVRTNEIYAQLITNPSLTFDHYEITDKADDYFKLITTSGIELHLNSSTSADIQLNKLAKVLNTNKLQLSNINYINLRIKDQVIYK